VDTRATRSSIAPASLAALLAAVSVAGCKVGPRYQRPDPKPVPVFKSQVGPSEANSIADLPWWQVFNDKALQSLITEGLTSNYDLLTATARIEEARQQVGVVRSQLFPQVGYQAFASRQKEFIPIEQFAKNVTYNSFGLALNAAWELDLWGRIRNASDAATANLYAQQDVRRALMLTLASDIATSYFLLIELDRELAIAQESSAIYKETLDYFTLRFEGGKDTKLAVDRAQGAYDASQASIASLNRAIVQAENALCILLGAYPRTITRGLGLAAQTMPPQTPVGETTALLERRPDIMQAEQVMIGANAEIGVAVANYFPVIGLSALFGGQAMHPEDIFKSNFNIWSIGAGLAGPIFQGGRLQAAYHAQQAYWDETIAQYKKTVITAFQETSDALIAQQMLVSQRAALEHQVGALREAVELALERYRAGKASYIEVLDAEQALFPSENALAQTQRDQLLAVVNLYKALGGGWNLKDDEWNQPQ
jgi:multidrug efflux system outer membrane protein